jgi:hypothetical protein
MQDVQRILTPLAAGQTISATGGTTDKYDGNTHLGKGEPMGAEIIVTAIDAASADETYTAQLRHDADSAFGSPTTIGPVLTIPRTITAPKTYVLAIPAHETGEQYWDVVFTLGGTTPSITVKVEVKPLREMQQDAAYADAVTIL